MKKTKIIIILLNLFLLLAYINISIVAKETTLREGRFVLLKLAPVDPRSLMQGDYMRLNYAIASDAFRHTLPKRGYCVVKLDRHHIAQMVRMQEGKLPLFKGEYLIKYFTSAFSINIGAESYFFEEGSQRRFINAKYGGLKIDGEGNSVLEGLYDGNCKLIR